MLCIILLLCMVDLRELLVQAKPAETSGASSANRADYHKDWALCLLLGLHESGKDFLLLLEHHDDVAVVDSPSAPQRVRFYQVKTSQANWTVKKLTTREKGSAGPLSSILGRLFRNAKLFGSTVEELGFITNARFKVNLDDGSSGLSLSNICFAKLSNEEKQKVRARMKEELGVDPPLPWESISFFVVADLSLQDHSSHAKGKLSGFLESAGKADLAVGALYRALAEEIRRRATYEGNCTTLSELAARKGISRSDLESMLVRASVADAPRHAWEHCKAQLTAEGVSFVEQVRVQQSWRRYEAERMDAANIAVQNFRTDIAARVKAHIARHPKGTLLDLVADVVKATAPPRSYSHDDVRAAILLEAHVHGQEHSVQKADPEPEEEGA